MKAMYSFYYFLHFLFVIQKTSVYGNTIDIFSCQKLNRAKINYY